MENSPSLIYLTFNCFGKETWPDIRIYIQTMWGKWKMACFVDQWIRQIEFLIQKTKCSGKRHVVEPTGGGTKSVDLYILDSIHNKGRTKNQGTRMTWIVNINQLWSLVTLVFVQWAQQQRNGSDKIGGLSISPTSWTFCQQGEHSYWWISNLEGTVINTEH